MASLRCRIPPADGITVRQKSRALFQQHRPTATLHHRKLPHCERFSRATTVAAGKVMTAARVTRLSCQNA